MSALLKKAIAECVGTFVLVFFACGTAIVTDADVVATALAFGLVIVAMSHCIGKISGCHINPAVSVAVLLTKKMNLKEFGFYVAAQFAGATLGAAVLYGILAASGADFSIWATNGVAGFGFGGYIGSLLLEIVLTFVFVYVILCVTGKNGNAKTAGFVIGLTLALVHLLGINLTGTSVNPARSFGPAVMSLIFGGGAEALAQLWIFLVAPLAGGALAALAFKYFNKEEDEKTVEQVA